MIAQPADSSARERRLAEALTNACESIAIHGEQPPADWLAALDEYHRSRLASPEAPAKDPLLTIECAIGGTCHMPDGRRFWIDGPVARELTRRVAAALGLEVQR